MNRLRYLLKALLILLKIYHQRMIYEQKDKMSTRVIDETILRIYFLRTFEVTATRIPDTIGATS